MLFSLWGQYIIPFLHGLVVTIEVTFLGLAMAVLIGAGLAACRLSRFRSLRLLATAYVDVLRAVPVIVILFLVYYGLGQEGLLLPGLWAAAIGLAVFYAALFAEIFRGGMQGVDRGQREAADALGMDTGLRLRRVILPQAFLAILLPGTNELSNILKDSSLVIVIGLSDLMSHAFDASSTTFRPMDMLALAGLIYLVVYLILARGLARWELHVQRTRT